MRRLLLLLPLALMACGDDGAVSTSSATTSTIVAPVLEDGRYIGLVPNAFGESASVMVDFDEVAWLSGEAANRAAEEDGVIAPGEGVPNDYYVRNEDERTVRLRIRNEATVEVVDRQCCELVELESGTAWLAWYRASDPHGLGGPGAYWWITVDGGAISHIEEQYRP